MLVHPFGIPVRGEMGLALGGRWGRLDPFPNVLLAPPDTEATTEDEKTGCTSCIAILYILCSWVYMQCYAMSFLLVCGGGGGRGFWSG